jgi:hypothetical protein
MPIYIYGSMLNYSNIIRKLNILQLWADVPTGLLLSMKEIYYTSLSSILISLKYIIYYRQISNTASLEHLYL